jgi:Protein of unknown function (DUF616)
MHAVVYTAIFGDYDTLKWPAPQNESCDFICFTDAKMPSCRHGWKFIRVRRNESVHPRMQAKRFKLLSHRIFPGGRLAWRYDPFSMRRRVDLSIWIDASLHIKNSAFVSKMRDALGEADWAMFAHPDRDCIYEEARVSATMAKYFGLPIMSQVEAYGSKVPHHGGLFACGVIVRREPAQEKIVRANKIWWNENLKWTYQDQLSLPYILRTSGDCHPRHIPGNLWSNEWFDHMPHNANI